VTNSSSWPVAFHTVLALKQGLDPADVQAIRERRLPEQQRYAALRRVNENQDLNLCAKIDHLRIADNRGTQPQARVARLSKSGIDLRFHKSSIKPSGFLRRIA